MQASVLNISYYVPLPARPLPGGSVGGKYQGLKRNI
jgi:hypothetical protein